MDVLHAVALGVLQGLTEFLPVSSSGHLVLAQQLSGAQIEHALAFDVARPGDGAPCARLPINSEVAVAVRGARA